MPSIRKELLVVGDRLLVKPQHGEERYVPLRAREGDLAIFLEKASVEITSKGPTTGSYPTARCCSS